MPGPHDTEEFKLLEKQNQEDVVVRKARWNSLKEEFIDAMMNGKPLHWPTLSAKYGFHSQTARNKASTGKWYAEIEERRKAREDILDKKLTERTEKALDVLNKDFATSEVAIRGRHATIARGLQSKAVGELAKRDLKSATLNELLKMLELGIVEERKAMGMKDTADTPPPEDNEVSSVFKPIAEQVGGHKKLQETGALLLKELQKMHGKPLVEDVEAKPTAEQRVYVDAGLDVPAVQSTAPDEFAVGAAHEVAKDAEVRTEDPGKAKPKIIITSKGVKKVPA